jgi:hypothetical protein
MALSPQLQAQSLIAKAPQLQKKDAGWNPASFLIFVSVKQYFTGYPCI